MEIQQLFPGLNRSWVFSIIQFDMSGGHCPTVCQPQRVSTRQKGRGGWWMMVKVNMQVVLKVRMMLGW